MAQTQKILVFLGLFLLGLDSLHDAHAYLDPGSGSMILQLLLGGLAGALVVLKLYWQRFTGLFKSSSPRPSDEEPSDDTSLP